jgi:hypothetical protein
MPKCELVELTAENRAALAQRQYRFRPSSELQQNKLTLQRIKCKDKEEDGGLNAEFLRDRNAIDYAKSRLCTSNEYELTYWRKNHMRHIVNNFNFEV